MIINENKALETIREVTEENDDDSINEELKSKNKSKY
jgi:hypothetical protein